MKRMRESAHSMICDVITVLFMLRPLKKTRQSYPVSNFKHFSRKSENCLILLIKFGTIHCTVSVGLTKCLETHLKETKVYYCLQ